MENVEYTLRDLTADDIFLVVNVIRKIGIKEMKNCFATPEVREAIKAAMQDGEGKKAEENEMASVGVAVMLEVAGVIIDHLPDCKAEIYALLAALSGMKADEIAALPSHVFMAMVKDTIRKKEFPDFFADVLGSLK